MLSAESVELPYNVAAYGIYAFFFIAILRSTREN